MKQTASPHRMTQTLKEKSLGMSIATATLRAKKNP
jgi:hypothetical protein